MSIVKQILQIFAMLIFVLEASAGEKTSGKLQSFVSKYEGYPVTPIHEKIELYSTPKKGSNWDIEGAVIENLTVTGIARCRGDSQKATPIFLFDSPKASKQLHTIACSNINDWVASEKTGTSADPFDRAVIVLREENDMIQIALSASLYNSDVTRKKMMSEFPTLGPWQNIYTAWIKKRALSPIERSKTAEAKTNLKKLILSQYDLDNIRNADIVVEKVHQIGSEFWLEMKVSVINTGFKRKAYAPILNSNGKPQFEIARDGDPKQ